MSYVYIKQKDGRLEPMKCSFNRKKLEEIAKPPTERELEERRRRKSKEFREAQRKALEEYYHSKK